jgi:hypothetical protein
MKRIGDSGSPWRKPLACFIRLPEISFKRILEEEDASKVAIQSLHLFPNPNTCLRYTELNKER